MANRIYYIDSQAGNDSNSGITSSWPLKTHCDRKFLPGDNPGLFYTGIECALWGNRKMVGGKCHIVLENLIFKNGGVHGYQEIRADNITIRNC